MVESVDVGLEKATGPDRDIDRRLAVVAGLTWGAGNSYDNPWLLAPEQKNAHANIIKGCPRFTESIDAALTLVPEGFEPHQLTFPQGKGRTFGFEIFPPTEHRAWAKGSVIERGQTAALAICAAALRARQETP